MKYDILIHTPVDDPGNTPKTDQQPDILENHTQSNKKEKLSRYKIWKEIQDQGQMSLT